MFGLPAENWICQRSHLGRGFGCYSMILMISPQCWILRCKHKSFHVQEDTRQRGKGQENRFFNRGNITLDTCGWCYVGITGSLFQSIDGSVLCIRRRCAFIDPEVISNPHSGHGILRCSLTWYESPTPVHANALASADILDISSSVWNVINRDLATLATRPYRQKIPTSTSIE